MSQEQKVDPGLIKKTQDTLGRIIQAPALTDKLLNRPPVQFVQDIVKSVIKNTGFMKGLYKSEELDAAYIKESKENKLAFLNKLIIIVGIVVGEQLSVKASKIAAGAEAEKTNELFQLLAKAINIKPDNDEVVKKALKAVKSGESGNEEKSKEKKEKDEEREKRSSEKDRDRDRHKQDESRERDREKDKEKDRGKDREKEKERDRDRDREKDKDRERGKDREKEKERDRDRDRDREKDKDRERGKDREKDKERDRDREREKDRDRDRDRTKEKEKERDHRDRDKAKDGDRDRDQSKKTRDSSRRERDLEEKEKSSSKTSDHKRDDKSRGRRGSVQEEENRKHSSSTSKPKESESSSRKIDNNDDNENDPNASRRRPSSAKGPRSHIEREENGNNGVSMNKIEAADDRNSLRPTTARPGAPRPRLNNEPEEPPVSKINTSSKAKSTLIVNSDSDDDFVVKEQKVQEDDNKKNFRDMNDEEDFNKMNANGRDQSNQEHGALVKKILESKEQLEYGSELNRSKDFKPVQNDMQRKKDREKIQKEIEKLKESIQTLTKASIPLGRTLEFLQEDIDMMQKELVKWTDEFDQNIKAFKRQQAEAQSVLEPYKGALNDIENQINDQLEKIASVKRKILLNEEKTSKLLFNVGKKN